MNSFQTFLENNKKYQYIEEEDTIVVAFSGGPDSVFLVEMLLELQNLCSFSFVLAHLHHGMRGETADQDVEFCKAYAKEKKLKLYLDYQDVPSYAKEHALTAEEAGRKLRYAFLESVQKKEGCQKIATGHHLDDHLETFFFRLLRGSSLEGLAGIARKRGQIIRPLRDFEKEEILAYLEQGGMSYCLDESNEKTDYSRNKLRLELLPLFADYNPRWKEKVAALMEDIAERKEAEKVDWKDYATEDGGALSAKKLLSEPVFLQKKILYHYLISQKIEVNRKQIDVLQGLLTKGGSIFYDLKKACQFKKEYDRIYTDYLREETKEDFHKRELAIPGTCRFGKYQVSTYLGKLERGTCFFLWDGQSPVYVRRYQSGDRMLIPGMQSAKKLKDIFINDKIPKEERGKIPILEYQEEIIALATFRRAAVRKEQKGKLVTVMIEEVTL